MGGSLLTVYHLDLVEVALKRLARNTEEVLKRITRFLGGTTETYIEHIFLPR